MRLDDAIQEYLTLGRARHLSVDTLRSREQVLHFYRNFAGNPRLRRIRRGDLIDFAAFMAEYVSPRTARPLRDTTIRMRMYEVCAFYEFCRTSGYLDANPATHIEVKVDPVDVSSKTIPLDDLVATVQWVLEHLSRNVERSLFILVALADSGLRVGEVARFEIPNINVDTRVLFTRRKHRRHQRLPISEAFVWSYRAWLRVRPKCDHDFVICAVSRTDHPPVSPSSLTNCVRYWTGQATGRKWSPHTLRHAWISQALNRAGVPSNVVKNIAGHSQLSTTEGYAAPDLEAQRAAIDAGPLLSHVFPNGVNRSPEIVQNDDGSVTIIVDGSGWFGA